MKLNVQYRSRPFSISENTKTLLVTLAGTRPSLWARIRGVPDKDIEAAFQGIAEQDELATVPILANYLAASGPIREFAISSIAQLMHRRETTQLQRLDEQCRRISEYSPQYWKWAELRIETIENCGSDPNLMGLFSFHPSGWVREAAVEKLNNITTGEEFCFLLLRTSDWVESVRAKAIAAVENRVHTVSESTLIANLALIGNLSDKTRVDLLNLQSTLQQALIARDGGLEVAIQSPNYRIRREAYRAAWRLDESEIERFIESGLKDHDCVIRLRSADRIKTLTNRQRQLELLRLLLNDGGHTLRYKALRLAVEIGGEERKDLLFRSIYDQSRSIREAARFYLARDGVDEFLALYISSLARGESVAPCLFGIGECGDVRDTALVKDFLDSERPRIAAAALTAFYNLSPQEAEQSLLENLQSRSPRVSNISRELLCEGTLTVEVSRIADIYCNLALRPHVRMNALKTLSAQGKWVRLPFLLRAHIDRCARIRRRASLYLANWMRQYNRSFVQPTAAELDEINTLLQTSIMQDDPSVNFVRSIVSELLAVRDRAR